MILHIMDDIGHRAAVHGEFFAAREYLAQTKERIAFIEAPQRLCNARTLGHLLIASEKSGHALVALACEESHAVIIQDELGHRALRTKTPCGVFLGARERT